MKFSNDEKRLAELILKFRDVKCGVIEDDKEQSINKKQKTEIPCSNEETLRTFKFILVENAKDSKEKAKSRVIELLKYVNRLDLIEKIATWTIPDFPIRGDILMQRNIPKGPVYSRVLEALRKSWMYDFDLDTSAETIEKLVSKCDQLIVQN